LPLSHLGVVDVDGLEVTETELMAHALANCAQTLREEDYMIRRGSAFVNEYARVNASTGQRNDGGPSDPNHLLGTFPTLFPFGRGGFEIERRVNVPYETHVRWALRYEDKRFRRDPHFPFQVFGVCQKRQVCRASVLQMKKGSFFQHQNLLSTLTANDLIKASQEETRGVPFSNPVVRALRSQLKAVKTKVQGTDESRISIRGKIWGTNLLHNPPSVWVTINPADIQERMYKKRHTHRASAASRQPECELP
jgi:Helitron helicase-like domain at N-terminus